MSKEEKWRGLIFFSAMFGLWVLLVVILLLTLPLQ